MVHHGRPPALIVARWFAVEQAAIEKLQGAQETAADSRPSGANRTTMRNGPSSCAVGLCRRAHRETQRSTARAVERYLVTRNWLFGRYIVEYEQSGADRAEYGAALIKRLADKLTIRGCSSRSLALSCKFYRCYSEILQTPSAQLETLEDVAWNGARFVAVGFHGAIVHSSDGDRWRLARDHRHLGCVTGAGRVDRTGQYRTLALPRAVRMRIRSGLAVSPRSTGSWPS